MKSINFSVEDSIYQSKVNSFNIFYTLAT